METDPEQGGQPEIDPVRDQIDDPWVALRRRIRIESNIPIIGRGSVNDLQQAAEKFLHPHQLQTGALSYTLGCVLKDSDMHEATYLRQSNEHARFVLEGVEGDYAPLFYRAPAALQIIRLTALLHFSGWSACVAAPERTDEQAACDITVTRAVLRSLSHAIPEYAQKALVLLAGQNILDRLLQGQDVTREMAVFCAEWPQELAEYRDDLLLTAYLSDASAHSTYRSRHRPWDALDQVVMPDDDRLTYLFEYRLNGQVTLKREYAARARTLLPGLHHARDLLTEAYC